MPNAQRECLEVMKSPKNTANSEKFDNRDEGAKKRGGEKPIRRLRMRNFSARVHLYANIPFSTTLEGKKQSTLIYKSVHKYKYFSYLCPWNKTGLQ